MDEMEVTVLTWIISVAGLLITGLLLALQFIAVVNPRGRWTIKNVYGGAPENTDPKAYFAFNQGFAWADSFSWLPIQIAGNIGMLLGRRWGFLMALIGSVPFWYSAILIFIWDRDMGYRQSTFVYWIFIWGIFPTFGAVQMVYCFLRLLE